MGKKTAEKYDKQLIRANRELKFVKLGLMRVSSLVQRELRQARVDYLVSVMDLEKLGNPEVSFRDGHYYIMDGQHRVEAVKQWLGTGWKEQHIQCWVATGLTEQQEAEIFLSLNDTLRVGAYEKFKVAVQADRRVEVNISEIVDGLNLSVSNQKVPGAIGAVGALLKSYKRDGGESFRKALVIAKNAFGDCGLVSPIIDGFGMMCCRYNSVLDEKSAIDALSKVSGGVNGLLGKAQALRLKCGKTIPYCVAAEAVRVINRKRTAKTKLATWEKEE